MDFADLDLVAGVPEDLDAKARELTGYSATALRDLLAEGHVIASTVARALHPFLAEPHDLAALAEKIAAAGVAEVKAEVVKLYDEAIGAVQQEGGASGEAEA